MLKFIKLLLIIILTSMLCSCGFLLSGAVYKIYYNAKIIPNYASEKKINKFYNKHASTRTGFIELSDSNFVKKIKEPGWAFDNWELYNINGYQVRRKGDSLSCIVSDYAFLKSMDSESMKIDSTSQLTNDTIIYSNLRDISEDNPIIYKEFDQFDYTLILYWSSWRGRFTRNILKLEKALVLHNPDLRIQEIKVNMDFRKEMKNTWINKISILSEEIKTK